MQTPYNVLIMGASYGSLFATKLLVAGHTVRLVCLPAEAELINKEGTRVRMPVRGRSEPVEIDSQRLPGELSAATPNAIDPSDYDLVILAMQEPQYRASQVRELLDAIAKAKVPCMSIMNMPPLPYLMRIPGLDVDALTHCYTDHTVWKNFDPALMTLCSPDPQAFRPPEEALNVLHVGLPANFKVARFSSDEHTAMLRQIQTDIDAARLDTGHGLLELPVKLKMRASVFMPLAKWSMLLTGNYRCVQRNDVRSIRDAVHSDIDLSRSIYNWVVELCKVLGASRADLVPFEKYAAAAKGLAKPSSVARALSAGATHIERVDRLVQTIATGKGMQSDVVDEIVALVDARLEANRQTD